MKLGPLTKLDKRNKTTSDRLDDGIISNICDVIIIFANSEQFGSRILKAQGVKLIFSLIVMYFHYSIVFSLLSIVFSLIININFILQRLKTELKRL